MSFRKYKFIRLFRSIFYSGYSVEQAAMISYWIKNKKPISERYLKRVIMTPMIKENIVEFTDEQLKYFDTILLNLKENENGEL